MNNRSVSLSLLIVTLLSTSLSVVGINYVADFSRCSFETSLCGWNWTVTGFDIDWRIGSSAAVNLQRSRGRFLYAGVVGSYGTLPGSGRVYVKSRVLTPSDNVCAIKFSFYFYHTGDDYAYAIVSVHSVEERYRSYTHLSTAYNTWQENLLTIDVVSPSVVVFELNLGQGTGLLALDDIQFIPCSVCTFEDDFCDWSNSQHSRSWIRYHGWSALASYSITRRPTTDYTLGSLAGYYLTVVATFQQAVLEGRELSYNDNICGVSFAYHMAGIQDSLTVTMKTTDGYVVSSWTTNGNQEDQWHHADLTTEFWNDRANSHQVLQVQISASVLRHYSAIAIDDVEYLSCVQFDECTFGLNFCTWKNSRQSKLQWHLEVNEADSPYNQLTVDLSNEEISDGDMASLVGANISQSDSICSLKIVYELYGQLVDTKLLVRICHLTDDQYTFVNLTRSSRNTSSGIEMQEIGLTDFPLVVFIETGKRKEEQGKVIIHSLQYLPCQKSTFEQTTNVIWHDSSPEMNATKWEVQSSSHNHSLGDKNGSFIVTNGPGLARLEADIQRFHAQPVCSIRFSYLACCCYNISVVTKDNHSTLPVTRHWLAVPSATLQRIEGVLFPKTYPDVSTVAIEATPIGDGSNAQLAIDDIELLPCLDFKTCLFERGLCGWTPSVTNSHDATWIRWYGNPPSSLMTDHMSHIANGYYLYVHLSVGVNRNGIAVLQGVPVSHDLHICGIRLWYYITPPAGGSSGSATLSVVFVLTSGKSVVVWSSETETSLQSALNQWNVIETTYRVLEEGHFELRANVSRRGEGVNPVTMTVDNVTYIECVTTNKGLDSSDGLYVENSFNDAVPLELDSVCPELVAADVSSSMHMPVYPSELRMLETHGLSPSNLPPSSALLYVGNPEISSLVLSNGLSPSNLPPSSTLLYVENPRVSGLSNTESNSPVLVIIGALSALLLFFIILIVIVLVAIRRRKTTKVKMQDVVLASPTSPRIYVREKPVQPMAENVYADVDTVGHPTSHAVVDEEPVYALPQPRHLRSRTNQSENVLYASTPPQSSPRMSEIDNPLYASTSPVPQSSASRMGPTPSGRTQENVIYQSLDDNT